MDQVWNQFQLLRNEREKVRRRDRGSCPEGKEGAKEPLGEQDLEDNVQVQAEKSLQCL